MLYLHVTLIKNTPGLVDFLSLLRLTLPSRALREVTGHDQPARLRPHHVDGVALGVGEQLQALRGLRGRDRSPPERVGNRHSAHSCFAFIRARSNRRD